MNQTQMMPVLSNETPQDTAPVCHIVPLTRFSDAHRELPFCAVPAQDSMEQLTRAFRAAPQFSQIPLEKLLERKGSRSFRMILLGENTYYLRQAAAYLTALSLKTRKETPSDNADFYWNDLDLSAFGLEVKKTSAEAPKSTLLAISSMLLDPAINLSNAPVSQPGVMAQMMREQESLDLTELKSSGILIAADSGKVLSDGVLNKVEAFLAQENPQDIFIALKSSQVELDLLEELRFTHGFQTCQVGQADQPYLRRLLVQLAKEQAVKLSSAVEPDKIISQLRRYRGAAFAESDLALLLQRAVERKGRKPLETADLLFQPCRSQGTQGREALNAMIGLQGVKDAMNRLLASAAMEDRRRMNGVDIPPSCRNLAFSGHPGTGKSVTARLAAQILREEGCGSGRFVEAGREQLIGPYLGHTSPMIAELFQQARGGVLFIDEAGALLDPDGRDTYAAEAVNALVRHMELEPETMVIFATYPEEMKKLLSSNPGLSSRVAQVLEFPDYNEEELVSIFSAFAHKERLTLPENSSAICADFFRQLRQRKGSDFGNGREARRLFQAAKEEMALRALTDPSADFGLSEADLRSAAGRLLAQEQGSTQVPIGFGL